MATRKKNDPMNALVTARANETLKSMAEEFGRDPRALRKFLDNPGPALKGLGVSIDERVKLDPRQRALIEVMADPRVNEMYSVGDIDGLRKHVATRYRDLLGSEIGSVAGWAVADFDVAIEVEAVAVAVVAVAAIAIGAVDQVGKFRQFEANAGVMTARIAALEARLSIVDRIEAKVDALSKRIR